jgi:hypothetical protein
MSYSKNADGFLRETCRCSDATRQPLRAIPETMFRILDRHRGQKGIKLQNR